MFWKFDVWQFKTSEIESVATRVPENPRDPSAEFVKILNTGSRSLQTHESENLYFSIQPQGGGQFVFLAMTCVAIQQEELYWLTAFVSLTQSWQPICQNAREVERNRFSARRSLGVAENLIWCFWETKLWCQCLVNWIAILCSLIVLIGAIDWLMALIG